jgi:hypothetical protein
MISELGVLSLIECRRRLRRPRLVPILTWILAAQVVGLAWLLW